MTDQVTGRPVPNVELGALVAVVRSSGRTIESTISGSSMRETLHPGSRIKILCEDPGSLPPGCVVAFVDEGKLVAHRLIRNAQRRHYLLTRGDNSDICDPPVPTTAVLGRVVATWQDDQWGELGAAPLRKGWRRFKSNLLALATLAGLWINPSLGKWTVQVVRALRRKRRMSPSARS